MIKKRKFMLSLKKIGGIGFAFTHEHRFLEKPLRWLNEKVKVRGQDLWVPSWWLS